MPRSLREQKRARREAKRKEKRKTMRTQSRGRSIRSMLMQALKWPVMECWVNEAWRDPTQLNQVAVARRNPSTGEVYVGMYLVDRACLGVKNAYAANFGSASEFRRELLSHLQEAQDMIQIDLDLAAAIVEAGIAYAAELGFRPHRDYRDASVLLRDAAPDTVEEEIPVGGPEGKPLFVAGPYDDVERIMGFLTRKLGPQDFNYMVQLAPDTELLRAEGDFDDEFVDVEGDLSEDEDEDIDWLLDEGA